MIISVYCEMLKTGWLVLVIVFPFESSVRYQSRAPVPVLNTSISSQKPSGSVKIAIVMPVSWYTRQTETSLRV